jgi:predicted O-methyltransferase YrrM
MSIDTEITLTPLIVRLEEMVREIPGWSPIDQLYTLHLLGLATAHLQGDFIEIGSWCGRSAIVLGEAGRSIGNTRIHCIDLFPQRNDWKQSPDGSYFFEVQVNGRLHRAHQEQTVWANAFDTQVAPIYEDFASPLDCFKKQIKRFDLGEIIQIHRGDSTAFASTLPDGFRCKLAFIDGDHGYKAVCQDIKIVKDRLVSGGWICFDDAFSSYEWVNRAIRDLILADPQFDLCQQMTRKLFVARKKPNLDTFAKRSIA